MAGVLEIHLEAADDGEIVWWAVTDDLPGFSAAASSLDELREQIHNAFEDMGLDSDFTERLIDEPVTS